MKLRMKTDRIRSRIDGRESSDQDQVYRADDDAGNVSGYQKYRQISHDDRTGSGHGSGDLTGIEKSGSRCAYTYH